MQAYIKSHKANEFYVKPLRGGKYYAVIDGYDMSTASLEVSREAADKEAEQLNATRNARI